MSKIAAIVGRAYSVDGAKLYATPQALAQNIEMALVQVTMIRTDGDVYANGDADTELLTEWFDAAGDEGADDFATRMFAQAKAADAPAIAVGDRVEGGEGDDHDTGRIVSIDGDIAQVAWDSHVTTPANLSSLRAL